MISQFSFLNALDDNPSYLIDYGSVIQEKNHALSYTKVLPVPLTTPDFSMPTMSSQSLARCLHCVLDRCSVRYEDEWERRKGFLTVKVTLSWIVFVVCSLDYGP